MPLRPLYAVFQLPPTAQLAAALFGLFGRYIFNDWEFLAFLMIFVTLDTITGLLAAWKCKEVNSRKLGRFATKLLVYSVLLIITHGLTSFRIHSVVNWFYKAFDAIVYTFLMGREAISILENLHRLDPELIPEAISKRLQTAITSVPERLIDSFSAKQLEGEKAPESEAEPTPAPEPTPDAAPVESAAQSQTTP